MTPLQLSFDEPVDLATLAANRDADPSNDTIYVVDVNPASPRFGERAAMDFGQGNYPLDLADFHASDAHGRAGLQAARVVEIDVQRVGLLEREAAHDEEEAAKAVDSPKVVDSLKVGDLAKKPARTTKVAAEKAAAEVAVPPVVVAKPVAAVVAPVAAKSEPVAPTAVEPKPAPVPAVMVTKPVERAPVKDSP